MCEMRVLVFVFVYVCVLLYASAQMRGMLKIIGMLMCAHAPIGCELNKRVARSH